MKIIQLKKLLIGNSSIRLKIGNFEQFSSEFFKNVPINLKLCNTFDISNYLVLNTSTLKFVEY